jgi:competence protein ComEC
MKFVNYTVVHFSILVALGITAAHCSPSISVPVFPIIFLLTVILFVTWILVRRQLFQNVYFGSIAFLCFFALGFFNYQIRTPNFQSNHFSHLKTVKKHSLLQLKVTEVLKSDVYNHKFISEVQFSDRRRSSGKVLVNVKKDSLIETYTLDDILLVSSEIKLLPKPLNPYQFDYSKYLKTLGVYGQIRISNLEIYKKFNGNKTLRGRAEQIRNHLLDKLDKTSLDLDERAILQALVLGQKKDISKELYSDYVDAGAVHILAVSGLHVGILFFIFSFILKPIKLIPHGNLLHSIVLVICLWSFAFITGLSPSVSRAVTMFSFFAFANSINRETNSINTLFLSFLVLLLINPQWLFQVGFQLSYLAVLSILIVQPKLRKYYRPKFYIDRLFWDIVTVSFAAQMGILPLSLYYFHQFPGLFFITNLGVLPVLGVLLGIGVLIVFLAGLNALPEWLVIAYNFLLSKLNQFITWVANQDRFLFEDIHFSEGKLVVSYIVIVTLILIWRSYSYKKLVLGIVSFGMLLCVFNWDKYIASESELIIFHKSRKTLIGYKHSTNLYLFKSDSGSYKNTYPIQGYRVAQQIKYFSEKSIPTAFKYRDKTFILLDSLGVFPKCNAQPIVILTHSPKVNLERLIDSLNPELIIADGSNYNSYVSRWRKTCKQKKLPFHHTGKEGAFIIE